MSDDVSARLRELATRCGVATEFLDWQFRQTQVSDETIVAVLTALGRPASTPEEIEQSLLDVELDPWRRTLPPVIVTRETSGGQVRVHVPHGSPVQVHVRTESGARFDLPQLDRWVDPREVDGQLTGEATFDLGTVLPLGWHTVVAVTEAGEARCSLIVTPTRMPTPGATVTSVAPAGSSLRRVSSAVEAHVPSQSWGFMTQLYSVRSRQSWGIGDFADLRDLAAWSGGDLAADFLLINPVHAAEPVGEMADSPYLPTTRRFVNPMYIRVEDIREAGYVTAAQRAEIEALAASTRWEGDPAAELLDRQTAWHAKRQALRIVYGVPRSAAREAAYAAYRFAEGEGLHGFATWCALTEHFDGRAFDQWPDEYRDVASPAVADLAERLADRISFYKWLQWIADEQLGAAHADALTAGMRFGLVLDLAVGVHPSGADAWALGSALARGVTVGAPPDAFNQQGQNWSQPPWRPDTLAESGYAPYRDMLRTVLRHTGGLRVDHVMGLFRLWWVPAGMAPSQGTYVYYDHEALLGIMCLEAHRAGAFLVGEDLGVVEPGARDVLADRGVLGTSVLWFERDGEGHPLPPEAYRRLCLATVTTHDLPPTAAYLVGQHVELRNELGLLTRDLEVERQAARDEVGSVLRAAAERGLIPAGGAVTEQIEGLYRFLTQTPSLLLGVALTDAVGELRTQNQPGTHTEYPNWRIPLRDGHDQLVWLEDLRDNVVVAALAAAVCRA